MVLNKLKLLLSAINQKKLAGLVVAVLIFGLAVRPAHAIFGIDFNAEEIAMSVVSWIVNLYVYIVGGFLTAILIPALIGIAQFNDIIGNKVVEIGWSLTRDVANMLFIVVLLIIAFSTMLRIQTYHYKQSLVKLIIMAVLINFSKLISGVLIDFFQVLMLTFVRGFQGALGGNFIQAFRIYDMLALSGVGTSKDLNVLAVIAGLVLAAVGLTVVVFTVMIMMIILLYRIVMLWLLVVLSPLAYFAYTIRPNYWSQWWSEFFKQLTTGPVIAFFLWLELKVAQELGTGDLLQGVVKADGTSVNPFSSQFAVPETFINYLTMVALMIGGLVVAQKMAAQTGGAVGNAAGKIQRFGTKAALGLAAGVSGAWLAKKAAKGVGTRFLDTMARSDKAKGALGRIATSRYGALIPGARGLARKGLIGLDKREAALDSMYSSFVGALPAKTKKAIAGKWKGFGGGERKRLIKAVRAGSPESIQSEGIMSQTLKDMTPKQLSNLKPYQLSSITKFYKDKKKYKNYDQFKAAALDGKFGEKFKNLVVHNTAAQRHLKTGFDIEEGFKPPKLNEIMDSQKEPVVSSQPPEQTASKPAPSPPPHRLADEGELEKAEKGQGAFGQGEFNAKHIRDNTLAFNFSDLGNKPGMDFLTDPREQYSGESRTVKGTSLRDPEVLQRFSQAMLGDENNDGYIDQQIKQLEEKGGPGVKEHIDRLNEFKAKLASGDVDHLQIINSGAVNYQGVSEIKHSLLEEKLHNFIGSGQMDPAEEEQVVDYALQQARTSGVYRGSDIESIGRAIRQADPQGDKYKAVDDIVAKLKQDRMQVESGQKPTGDYQEALKAMNDDADIFEKLYKETGDEKYKKWADDTRSRADSSNIDGAIEYYEESVASGQADDKDKTTLRHLKAEKARRQRVVEAAAQREAPMESFEDVVVAMKGSENFDQNAIEQHLEASMTKGKGVAGLENMKVMIEGALHVNAEEMKYAKENNETKEVDRLNKERFKMENMQHIISSEQERRNGKRVRDVKSAADVYNAMSTDDFQSGLKDNYEKKKRLFGEKIIKTPAPDAKKVAIQAIKTGDTGAAREVIQKAIVDNDRAINMTKDKKTKAKLQAKGNKLRQMDQVLEKEQGRREKLLGLDTKPIEVEVAPVPKLRFDQAIQKVLSKDFQASVVPHTERVRKGGVEQPIQKMPDIKKLALDSIKSGQEGQNARAKLAEQIKLQIANLQKTAQTASTARDRSGLEAANQKIAQLNSMLSSIQSAGAERGTQASAITTALGSILNQKLLHASQGDMQQVEQSISQALSSGKSQDLDRVLKFVNSALASQTQDRDVNVQKKADPEIVREIDQKIAKLNSVKNILESEKVSKKKIEISQERKEQQAVLNKKRAETVKETTPQKTAPASPASQQKINKGQEALKNFTSTTAGKDETGYATMIEHLEDIKNALNTLVDQGSISQNPLSGFGSDISPLTLAELQDELNRSNKDMGRLIRRLLKST